MSETTGTPETPETAPVPIVLPESIPQALGALALLTPEQEKLRQAWREQTCPESRVEGFLEANVDIFVASGQAWRYIKDGQEELTQISVEASKQHDLLFSGQNRKARRQASKSGYLNTPAATFAHVKHGASMGFSGLEGETVQEKIINFAGQVVELQDEYQHGIEGVKGVGANFIRHAARLLDGHLWANATQQLAEQETFELLDTPETSRSFVQRLHELAANARSGLVEYPGFLEIIALNNAVEGKEGLLRHAASKGALSSPHYAQEFLQNPSVSHSREAGIAFKAIQLSAQFFRNRPQAESLEKSFMDFIADSTDEWPQDLRNGLEVYTLARNNAAFEALENAVKPSLRTGRLPAQVHGTSKIQVLGNGALVKTKRLKTTDRKGQKHIVPSFTIGKEGQDHEDITEEKQPPITKFAFFMGNGGREDRFSLGPVGDIDTILEKGQLRDYIQGFVGENALEGAIKAGLESLSVDPFNRERTTRLVKGGYVLDGTQHRMRRLSLQRFPGITTGRIGNKTRIFYDVVVTPDGPVIGIYGAVFKQDSEKPDRLPRR